MTCDPWPVEWCGDGPPADTTTEQQDQAVLEATEVLHALSGFQFSRCRRTFHLRGDDVCTVWPHTLATFRVTGPPPNPCCVVEVGVNPEVHGITIDGVDLDPSGWFLSGRWLVKADGSCWPTTPPCDPARTIVDLTTGFPPPAVAARAVGELAEQLLIACGADGECVLPSRVVTVNRQGIGMNLLDPIDYTTNGKLGLPICDTFLMSFNPDRLRANAKVLTPDTRRVAWLS